MIEYDISKFEELVKEGMLRKSEKGDLILYNYTDACTFARNWNEYTLAARGLILEKETGKVIAKPFSKFFNLNEREDTQLGNLPKCNYTVSEKADGSLGIIFHHDGKWQVATRGSFYSEQAVKALEILGKYELSWLPKYITLLVEIIYPSNKIIVNYGQEEKLVLLGAYDRETGNEFEDHIVEEFSDRTKMPKAKAYRYTIPQMIELQKTLPKDEEGFVVRYDNGLRVKIKGDEYMRIAKIISHLSPISLWESMVKGKVNKEYLAELPDELRADYEPTVQILEKQYEDMWVSIPGIIDDLPSDIFDLESPWRPKLGRYLAQNEVKHTGAIFPYLLKQLDVVDKYIMKQIRPDGNVLRSIT